MGKKLFFIYLNLIYRQLEEGFKVPVYDRYNVVLQIFQQHAQSQVAKLQVALAEIPYLRSRLHGLALGDLDRGGGGVGAIGGSGETLLETRRRLLEIREGKLKNALESLKRHRQVTRMSRIREQVPTVAVVGYTNAALIWPILIVTGKTSLIKALTGEKSLEPKDHLFATLDVTMHSGLLPSRLTTLFVDTVGFIADIPLALIQAFAATLEDALMADVIVHVRDMSHPDAKNQERTVLDTLTKSLSAERKKLDGMITIGNKIDCLGPNELEEMKSTASQNGLFLTSCINRTGLEEVREEIEKRLMEVKELAVLHFSIPAGGEEARWLYKYCTVTEEFLNPEDSQKTCLKVIISKASLGRFHKAFPLLHPIL
ncbi:unnamed protein product [Darwinula stevensoni]|uniref:Hflx-type G domain-containing protein n=1 Tax=Darwinula stevensoni TaxID=69355 RepID=A0A7R8X7T4_9CRUS|nr:unnamed protein product [Darwinula stevensoni]CAG0889028.1 unnamed protein product [Darwinula stevensoni]